MFRLAVTLTLGATCATSALTAEPTRALPGGQRG
jgi:hypothetical protein